MNCNRKNTIIKGKIHNTLQHSNKNCKEAVNANDLRFTGSWQLDEDRYTYLSQFGFEKHMKQ